MFQKTICLHEHLQLFVFNVYFFKKISKLKLCKVFFIFELLLKQNVKITVFFETSMWHAAVKVTGFQFRIAL